MSIRVPTVLPRGMVLHPVRHELAVHGFSPSECVSLWQLHRTPRVVQNGFVLLWWLHISYRYRPFDEYLRSAQFLTWRPMYAANFKDYWSVRMSCNARYVCWKSREGLGL